MKAKCVLFVCLVTGTLARAETGMPAFESTEVDGDVKIGYGIALEDVNGDGKTDILLVDKDLIVWYENPGWEKHVMAEELTPRDHVCIAARDINGDGKAEVAVGAEWNPGDTVNSGAVFYLIPPEDRTERWEPVRLHHEPVVHRMRWVLNWRGEYELVVLPLHGRGNEGGRGEGVKILAYSVPEDPRGEWPTRLLNGELHLTHNMDPANWDDDQTEELLIASREGVYALNWVDQALRLVPVVESGEQGFPGAGEVRLGRLPNGKPYVATVEPMHGEHAVVYTKQENGWNRQVIDDSLRGGHAVACGDLLGKGYDQLIVGWRRQNDEGKVGIRLYVPADEGGGSWKQAVIDDNTMACEDARLADLDGDGRLDVVAAGRATHNLKIYWNRAER